MKIHCIRMFRFNLRRGCVDLEVYKINLYIVDQRGLRLSNLLTMQVSRGHGRSCHDGISGFMPACVCCLKMLLQLHAQTAACTH